MRQNTSKPAASEKRQKSPKTFLHAFAKLSRIDHAIFLSIATITGALIASPASRLTDTVAIAALVPFIIEIGAFTLNDFLDLPTDRANKRYDRPLVTGAISAKTALWAAAITLPLGVALAGLFLNYYAFAIAAVFAALSIAYSVWLKKIALVGNVTIGVCMGIPFVFGNIVVAASVLNTVWLFAGMAFFMGFGREIFKSVQDLAGDLKTGRRTLPAVVGEKASKVLASLLVLAAITVSPLPYFNSLDAGAGLSASYVGSGIYAALIILTDWILVASIMMAFENKMKKVRKLTLAAQATGLFAILFGLKY